MLEQGILTGEAEDTRCPYCLQAPMLEWTSGDMATLESFLFLKVTLNHTLVNHLNYSSPRCTLTKLLLLIFFVHPFRET